jgi:D-alanyl-D-alanine carboxypeptidase
MDGRWVRREGVALAIAGSTLLVAWAVPSAQANRPAGHSRQIATAQRQLTAAGEPAVAAGDLATTQGGGFAGKFGAPAQPLPSIPLPLPACTYADKPAIRVGYDDWARTLVDTTFALPRSYVPPDLVSVSRARIAGSGLVRAIVIDDLGAMARAARKADAPLAIRSAYRSYRRQASVFAGWVAASGREQAIRFSARPGHSEHQLGTAVDLQAVGGADPWQIDFAATRQGRWVARNAWRYGFVVSYPPRSKAVACYGAEAWHVRYVGIGVAREVHDSGRTLREWLWLHAE